MKADLLHVFAARFNPFRWHTPERHYRDFAEHMLDSGVRLTVVECQYGERPFVCGLPHVNHIGVRASSPAWAKEDLINIGIARVPEAKYIAWLDADIFFEKPGWAAETVQALQLYHWIQPWTQCIDRGPHGEILNEGRAFTSFCAQFEAGYPLIPNRHGWQRCCPYSYPHPGYAWATRRDILEHLDGPLFAWGGMGASDHAMALALIGKAGKSVPTKGANGRYLEKLLRWQVQVEYAVHRRIGYANNVINHRFHGRKVNRQYLGRWQMFLRHDFNPDTDLKRNSYGVLEWAGNKPELEREWRLYLRARNEDINSAE
jgi:hypothetical protein